MANKIKKFVKCSLLGTGSYGSVYLAAPAPLPPPPGFSTTTSTRSGYSTITSTRSDVVAVKSACLEHCLSLKLEALILADLRGCPDIIQCYGDDYSIDEHNRIIYNLLLEYAPAGNLHQLIQKSGPTLQGWEVEWCTYKLLKGLSYIHKRGYVHCDFKPANILVFPSPRTGLNYLKIADFGLAKKRGDHDQDVRKGGYFRCPPLYSSPESIFGKHEAPMDIWALGCIVVEMVTGKPMWSSCEDIDDLAYNILMKDVPELPARMSEEGKDFLRKCLDRNPEKRWTAKMLLNHPYIEKCKFGIIDEDRKMLATTSPLGFEWVSTVSLLGYLVLRTKFL